MSSPQITLQTVTGVDVELTIAGPGSRSYAFIVDWHIRLLVMLAWLLAGHLIYSGGTFQIAPNPGYGYVLWVWLPALAIYFLYHPVLEIAMRGRTPGKRIAGVRLVTREGDIPGVGALLLRNVFRVVDSMPLAYLVGLATVVMTQEHVRIGDLAAGTLLVMDHDSSASTFTSSAATKNGLTPQAADLIQELLDRWPALDETTGPPLRGRCSRDWSRRCLAQNWRSSARSTCAAVSSPSWVRHEREHRAAGVGNLAHCGVARPGPILDGLERKRDHSVTDTLRAIELYRALGRDLSIVRRTAARQPHDARARAKLREAARGHLSQAA